MNSAKLKEKHLNGRLFLNTLERKPNVILRQGGWELMIIHIIGDKNPPYDPFDDLVIATGTLIHKASEICGGAKMAAARAIHAAHRSCEAKQARQDLYGRS